MFSTASVTRTFRRKFSSLTFINNTGLYLWSWLVLCTKSFVYVTIYLSKSKSARFVVEVVTKPPIKKMHQTRRQTQNMLSCRLAAQKACYMIGKILTHITKPNSSCDERSKLSRTRNICFFKTISEMFFWEKMISLCYLSFTSYLCSHNNSSSKSVNIHPHIMVSCSLFSDRNFHYVSQGTSCWLSIYLTVNLQEKRAAKTSRKLKNSKIISLHRFLLILELVEMLLACFDLLIHYKRTVLRAKKYAWGSLLSRLRTIVRSVRNWAATCIMTVSLRLEKKKLETELPAIFKTYQGVNLSKVMGLVSWGSQKEILAVQPILFSIYSIKPNGL